MPLEVEANSYEIAICLYAIGSFMFYGASCSLGQLDKIVWMHNTSITNFTYDIIKFVFCFFYIFFEKFKIKKRFLVGILIERPGIYSN